MCDLSLAEVLRVLVAVRPRAAFLVCLLSAACALSASAADDAKTGYPLRFLYTGPTRIVISEGTSIALDVSVINTSSSRKSSAATVKAEASGIEIVGEGVFPVKELAPSNGIGPFRIHVKASKSEERGQLRLTFNGVPSSHVEIDFEVFKLKSLPPASPPTPSLLRTFKFDSLSGNSDWYLTTARASMVKNGNTKGVEIEIDRETKFLFGSIIDDPKRFLIACESDGGVTAIIDLEKTGGERMAVAFKPPQDFTTFSVPAPRSTKGLCKLRALRLEGAGKFKLYSLSLLAGKPFDQRVVLKGQRFFRGENPETEGFAVEMGSAFQVEIPDSSGADLMVTLKPSQATGNSQPPSRSQPISSVGKSGMMVRVDDADSAGLYELKVESASLSAPYVAKLLVASTESEITRYFKRQEPSQSTTDASKMAPTSQTAVKDAKKTANGQRQADTPATPKVAPSPPSPALPQQKTQSVPQKADPQSSVPETLPYASEFLFYFPTPQTVAERLRTDPEVFVRFDNPLFNSLDRDDLNPDIADIMGMNDCLEGVNRTMLGFNIGLMKWVFRPVGVVYASVCPRVAVNAISRFSKNLEWPARLFSCMLQGKFAAAGEESLSFLINTTLGVAGLFIPAEKWFGLEPHDEDFGQAFASWGCGAGCYLVLPIQGPTSLRDAIGLIFDSALDPKTYIPYGGSWLFRINSGALNYADFRLLVDANKDPYVLAKQLWIIARQLQIAN